MKKRNFIIAILGSLFLSTKKVNASYDSASLTGTRAIRSGQVALIITDLTKAITFGVALPNANYEVVFAATSSLALPILWASSKTTAGFTLNLGTGVVATLSYVAVSN